tara:strand:- start:2906 stop:4126 length:1221 start_codon:yes stop_codon:yes gene_type:complete
MKTKYDVIVIGAGLIGMLFARTIAALGIKVAIIDKKSPKEIIHSADNGKNIALSFSSIQFLNFLKIWRSLNKFSQPIVDISVLEKQSSVLLDFTSSDFHDHPFGYMVENFNLNRIIFDDVKKNKKIDLLLNNELQEITLGDSPCVQLSSGKELYSSIVVAADGKNSRARKLANIKVRNFDYKQIAIVSNILHTKPHNGLAIEKFFPSGPLAVLPLRSKGKKFYSSIVWVEKIESKNFFQNLSNDSFDKFLQKKIGSQFGIITSCGSRFLYPLKLSVADRYVLSKLVLIGDAAHTIHPIAGQGLNLGLRDVAALAETFADALKLGLDIGNDQMLRDYENSRNADAQSMILFTDGMNRLFSNHSRILKSLRNFGLDLVDQSSILKKFFVKRAVSVSENAPRLMKGEIL